MADQFTPPPPSLPAGSRVWAYLRDSGGNQQERSVPRQERGLEEYCRRYGLYIVPGKVFRDVAKPGGSTDKRVGLNALMEQSKNKSIRPDGVLFWDYSRLARNVDDAQLCKSTLRARKIIVHSITDQIYYDARGAWKLVEFVRDWGNEQENIQKSINIKSSLSHNASKGFAPGTPPKGYRSVPVPVGQFRNGKPRFISRWEPDPTLHEYVVLAWELRAAGKSYAEITKATRGRLYTSAASWNTFFSNRSYLGFYGKGEREIPDHHEPLITFEVFETVQRLNEARKHDSNFHPRRVGCPTLLSGFTFCLSCGGAMTHSPGHKNSPWRHYLCGKKHNHKFKACKSRRVGADKVESIIIETLVTKILTPGYFSDALELAKQKLDTSSEVERDLTAEQRRLEDLEIGINRLLRTIERTGSESAFELLSQREAERSQARMEIDRLQHQLAQSQIEITPEAVPLILGAWCDQFNRLQEAGSIREIKEFIMSFIARIELGYNHEKKTNQASIHYTYPMTEIDMKARFTSFKFGGTLRKMQMPVMVVMF